MNKKFLRLLSIPAVFGLLLIACHHQGGNHKDRMDSMVRGISWTLDFDKTQKQQLENIKSEIEQKRIEQKGDRQIAFSRLIDFVKSEKIDKYDLENFVDQQIKQMLKNKDFFIDKAIEFHGILNTKQKEKIVEMMEERQKKMMDNY